MASILEIFNLDAKQLEEKGINIIDDTDVLQLKISSFSSFDYLISLFGQENDPFDCRWERYYRGVSKKEYDLECSLCVNKIEKEEAEIIDSMYARAPEVFSACKSDFEMVALMQHYGLPTRLLDFTRNPLVALWFACQRNEEKKFGDCDGAVYLAFSMRNAPKNIVDTIFKIASTYEFGKIMSLEECITREELYRYIRAKEILYNHMWFIDAPVVDLRERNQQAVFLLGINDVFMSGKDNSNEKEQIDGENAIYALKELVSKKSHKSFYLGEIHCYKKERDYDKILKIIIPQKEKEGMLAELKARGINEAFIYPTLDNYSKEIKEKAKQRRKTFDEKALYKPFLKQE